MIPYDIYEYTQLIKFISFVLMIVFTTLDYTKGKFTKKISFVILFSMLGKPFYSGFAVAFIAAALLLIGEKYKSKLANLPILNRIKNKNAIFYIVIPVAIASITNIFSMMYFYFPEDLQLNVYTTVSLMAIYILSLVLSFLFTTVWNIIAFLINKTFLKKKKQLKYANYSIAVIMYSTAIVLV